MCAPGDQSQWGCAPNPARGLTGPHRPVPPPRGAHVRTRGPVPVGLRPEPLAGANGAPSPRTGQEASDRSSYQRITFISSMFTVSLFRKNARMIPSPTAASAAATAITNTTNT